eukprot:6557788-Alexandrium_andersonii.AAC.1
MPATAPADPCGGQPGLRPVRTPRFLAAMGRAAGSQGRSRRQMVKPMHAWQRWAARRRAGMDDGCPAPR